MTIYEALSVIVSVLVPVMAVAVGLFRYAVSQKQAEFEAAFKALHAKNEKQDEENRRTVDRLHEQELHTLKLQGELQLANAHSDNLINDVEEIKETMVTKSEFASLRSMLEDAVKMIRSAGGYRSPSTPFPERGGGGGGGGGLGGGRR